MCYPCHEVNLRPPPSLRGPEMIFFSLSIRPSPERTRSYKLLDGPRRPFKTVSTLCVYGFRLDVPSVVNRRRTNQKYAYK